MRDEEEEAIPDPVGLRRRRGGCRSWILECYDYYYYYHRHDSGCDLGRLTEPAAVSRVRFCCDLGLKELRCRARARTMRRGGGCDPRLKELRCRSWISARQQQLLETATVRRVVGSFVGGGGGS